MKSETTQPAAGTPRPYSSPLRAEQAARTRERIVDAAVELLGRGDATEFGMQDVADEAGVSVRTVYRNFATRDDLLDGVVAAISDRMGERAGPPPVTLGDYVASAREAVGAVSDLEHLYRALFATQAGRESHQRAAGQRRAAITGSLTSAIADLDDADAPLFASLLHLASSSTSVLFLKDYWGLDPDDAGRALRWMTSVLVDALQDEALRELL